MKVGFLGNSLNLLSGSAKPLFGLMASLESRNYQCQMLSSRLPRELEDINADLIVKNNCGKLNITRESDDIINALFKRKIDTLMEIKALCNDSDILICTDFLLPWLLERNQFNPGIPLVFIASNNIQLKLEYLVKSGPLSFLNLMKPSFSSKLVLPNYFYRIALSKFDHIIATSQFVKKSFEEISITSPITVLPVGITIPNNIEGCDCMEDYFSFFGWGSGIRGLQDVLSGYEKYHANGGSSGLKLFLQGRHGYEESLYVKRIRKLNFGRHIDLQFFNSDIDKFILSSKVVILPFRVPFGYSQPPLTVLESMALGRVVISTNVGSIPEIIVDGQNGFLVPIAKPERISKILLTLNEKEIFEIGNSARETIKNNYEWSDVCQKYIHTIETIRSDFNGN
jgi:glycosyltransferase involved in cell wall biosynthesis